MNDECPFCHPDNNLILLEWEHSILLANLFPLGSLASLLVVPKDHFPSIIDLPSYKSANLWTLVEWAHAGLKGALNPKGVNIFLNDGEIAGQSIPHLHVHIVAREANDGLENFKRFGEKTLITEKQTAAMRKIFKQ